MNQAPQETTLAQRHSQILQKMALHAKSDAELIAVSKLQPAEKIAELYHLGQRRFGENYAQELTDKAELLKDLAIEWIFIGHIQSNKIRRIVSAASEIQTVSSLSQAQAIARCAKECGKAPFPIMLEVNAGDEANKSGLPLAKVTDLARQISDTLPDLIVKGLMAIPPDQYSDEACTMIPELYQDLRRTADGIGLGKLSLGMSGDLRIALESGSDFVRIGTALFGPRT